MCGIIALHPYTEAHGVRKLACVFECVSIGALWAHRFLHWIGFSRPPREMMESGLSGFLLLHLRPQKSSDIIVTGVARVGSHGTEVQTILAAAKGEAGIVHCFGVDYDCALTTVAGLLDP